MIITEKPIVESLPPPRLVRDRLGDALREVELLRGLLRLSKRAEEYRRQPLGEKKAVADGD